MMPYILHVAVIVAGCWVFYRLLLQKETFFKVNRWVLLGCLTLAFALPVVQVPWQWSFRQAPREVITTQAGLPTAVVSDAPATVSVSEPATLPTFNRSTIIQWIGWLYWFGVIAFGCNFLLQVIVLYYRAYRLPVIKDGRIRIIELNGDQAPCSFGNNIFINPAKYDWETYTQILLHEKEHIKQGHTIDLLLAELVLILQWFNPFAWLYRKEIEKNLEFLADDQLLHHTAVDREAYQLSLLKVSAPHLPLNITTNYNQSLLKKRVAMMNAKRSNVHTSWKYFFLLPMLVLLVCLINKPVAHAQAPEKPVQAKTTSVNENKGIATDGTWFGVAKNGILTVQLKSDEDDNAANSVRFNLSKMKELPYDKPGTFTFVRDAGTLAFTGKFEGANGMGTYVFKPDASYAETMRKQGIEFEKESDQMVFYILDVDKSYPGMLKSQGYKNLTRHDIIPLAALKVDEAYISMMKKNGFNLSLQDLIPLKSFGVDAAYIDEIRKAGYPNVSVAQLIIFKSQGINGEYAANKKKRDSTEALKSPDVDSAYIASLEAVGYGQTPKHLLVVMKALDITADYIQSFLKAGYTDIAPGEFVPLKANGITVDYMKSFGNVGYDKLGHREAVTYKSMGITPEYIRELESLDLGKIDQQSLMVYKSQGVNAAVVKEYQSLGFAGLTLNEVMNARSTGTTPAFIKQMREKGHDFPSIQKYIQLKIAAR